MIERRKFSRREYDNISVKLENIDNWIMGDLKKGKEGVFFLVRSLCRRVSSHDVLFLIFITSLVGMVFLK